MIYREDHFFSALIRPRNRRLSKKTGKNEEKLFSTICESKYNKNCQISLDNKQGQYNTHKLPKSL